MKVTGMDRYIAKALEAGIDHAIVIETSKVYTAPWVRMKCQFGCARYGQSHCCPPRTPTSDEMRRILDSYTHAIFLHRNWKEGIQRIDAFNDAVVDLELVLFFDGYYKAWSMGSGPCRMCEQCNIAGQCVHCAKARPSMEACGIDVFKTAREQGLSIHVLRDRQEERHSYGLVLIA
jgi:predicted metal-binding protein